MSTLRKSPAAVLPLLLIPWQLAVAAPPVAPGKPAENPWVIILASHRDEQPLYAARHAMKEKNGLQWLKPVEGFPKMIETASLPGLAPGLRVLVLGVCGSKEAALAARARVLPMVEDAYVKQLTGAVPLACPALLSTQSKLPRGAVRLASVPYKQDKDLALAVYKVNERSVMECKTSDLLFRLEYGREVIDQLAIKGECSGVCTKEAKKEGEEKVAEIRKRLEAGDGSDSELDYNFTECQSFTSRFLGVLGGYDRPWVFVSMPVLHHHDVVSDLGGAVGVACGHLISVTEYDEPGVTEHLSRYLDRAEARRKPPPDQDTVEIGVMEKPEGAAAGAPPVWTKVAEFDDSGCSFELDRADPAP